MSKATITQAFTGTLLFHMLFVVSPMAGQTIFGSTQIKVDREEQIPI